LIEVIQLVLTHPIATIFVLVGTGWGASSIIKALLSPQQMRLSHRERMAEIESRTTAAKAIAALPESPEREELVKQLLEAYGEAGEGLKNDEKGSLVRWELSKDDD
jgi:hypothetical protein